MEESFPLFVRNFLLTSSNRFFPSLFFLVGYCMLKEVGTIDHACMYVDHNIKRLRKLIRIPQKPGKSKRTFLRRSAFTYIGSQSD